MPYTSDGQTTARGPDTAPERFYPARNMIPKFKENK
jgi:hypothetical protein